MAKARAIVKRRKAVQNIRKITRTMQLIATARFQAAFTRATRTKPYTEGITAMVEQVARAAGDVEHPLLRANDEAGTSVVLLITSNRGLCGGYNASLLRAVQEQLRESVDLYVVGKKGIGYFRFMRRKLASTDTRFEDKPKFEDVEEIAVRMMTAYEERKIKAVYVTSMQFVSTATQRPTTIKLLPIDRPAADEKASGATVQYEFSPPADELLRELLPETVKVRLFQAFTDATVSEQVARMVAMKSASDSAGDMVRALTRQYNRARQSQITLELLDIVCGAEALNA